MLSENNWEPFFSKCQFSHVHTGEYIAANGTRGGGGGGKIKSFGHLGPFLTRNQEFFDFFRKNKIKIMKKTRIFMKK